MGRWVVGSRVHGSVESLSLLGRGSRVEGPLGRWVCWVYWVYWVVGSLGRWVIGSLGPWVEGRESRVESRGSRVHGVHWVVESGGRWVRWVHGSVGLLSRGSIGSLSLLSRESLSLLSRWVVGSGGR